MWCLRVVIALPDYKRPSVDVIVKHYKSKESAEKELQRIKEEFFDGELKDDEDFDKGFELYVNEYYNDNSSSMRIPPFDSEIFLVEPLD